MKNKKKAAITAKPVTEADNPSNGWRAPEGTEVAQAPKAAPTPEPKRCPECGADIPRRYRICDDCLAKHRAARKAARKPASAPAEVPQDAQPASPEAQA